MSKKETYVTVQNNIINKHDLVKKLGIKTFPERGKVTRILKKLRLDKKISTKTNAIEQLKDVDKWLSSHFDEFKKLYEKEK